MSPSTSSHPTSPQPRSALSRLASIGALALTIASIAGAAYAVGPARGPASSRPAVPPTARRIGGRRSAPGGADAGSAARLPGHVLPALAGATPVVTADGAEHAEPLTITFVLRHDDQDGFERYLRELSEPDSPNYRRFLSQPEIADRFGPSRDAYDRLVSYLETNGLTVLEPSANRLTLTVRGTRAEVERALRVRIGDYRLGDRTFYANDDDPALPDEIAADVESVAGLSSLARPEASIAKYLAFILCPLLVAPIDCGPLRKTCLKKRDDGKPLIDPYKQCITNIRNAIANNTNIDWDFLNYSGMFTSDSCVNLGQPCPTGFVPYDSVFLTRSGARAAPRAVNPVNGTAQKIAIVGFDTFAMSDVAEYLQLLGLPASNLANLSQVHVNGGATPGANQDELLLDVTTVMTIAPAAEVVVYDAPSNGPGTFQALFNAAVNGGATVITNSFAYCEDQTSLTDVQGIDTIFQNAAMSNITIFNATGDNGSTCLDGSPHTAHVPASSPHAIAVGGSSVTSGQGKNRLSETWWNGVNATPPTGQGGFGVSRFFPRPSYQDGFTTSPMRSIPDVVANADPANGVMICQASDGGCPTGAFYGGTSLTAPLWAAYTALINQAVGHNLGFANPALYQLAATPGFNNAAALSSDFAHVGLGSPNVDRLIVLLRGDTIGTPDPDLSLVSLALEIQVLAGFDIPVVVPADGVSQGFMVVTLLDANQHAVSGKTVSLAASPSNHVIITPASVVSDNYGRAVFTLKNLTVEDVTFTATDTTDNIPLATNPIFSFTVPPAKGGNCGANPATVTANGTAFTTITVTLVDGLNRPTPGKEVHLSQAGGHSVVSGPNPSVTDASGQIQFTATNKVNETVTYSAVDVTDDEVPVPGNPQVTFNNGGGSCVNLTPPTGQNGFVVTPFATGFAAENFFFGGVNWGGCPGASNPAFRGPDVFIADFRTGGVYRFGGDGGAVSSANILATDGPTLGFPVVGKDGRLYASLGSATNAAGSGSIVELDPSTGAVLRTLASSLKCPANVAVDPLSGDLFFTHECFGGSLEDASLHRIVDPAGASPTLEVYATLPSGTNGGVAFAANGTIYVAVDYAATPRVVRVAGTDTPGPPVVTPLTGTPVIFSLAVGEVGPDGEARSLLGATLQGLTLFDITTMPATGVVIASLGSGVIGPDGCLYASNSDTVYKVANVSGACQFNPTTAFPSLTLTPASISPDPLQGTTQTFTATFHNLDVPEGTGVLFQVSGANPGIQMASTDAGGEAVLMLTGAAVGSDVIAAQATVGDAVLTSNKARVTWAPGKHPTFLTLNLSPSGGIPGLPVQIGASLVDSSAFPPLPVAGATVQFMLGATPCSGTTDAKGRAMCAIVPAAATTTMLSATFDGTAQLLPASDATAFDVVGGEPLASFMVYQAKPSKQSPKLVKFGPVTLADELGSAGYDVTKPTTLGLPASRDGDVIADPDTHLEAYAIKLAKGSSKFVARTNAHFANQCQDAVVTISKPVSVMLPTAKDLSNPVSPPQEADHNVDHFLCYKVKTQKKRQDGTPTTRFAKGVQVDVADQFQTRRYDLKKLALLCDPVAKSGNPTLLAGPAKGTPFPITPSTIRNPAAHLLCYTAKLATKTIAQNGCGPANPADKGTKLTQAKTLPHLGVHVANQFASGQLDTKKESLLCIPSIALP